METRRRLSKPALFELLGYEPHPGQLEVHRSRAPRRVVACGVRWGKTLCAAMEALSAAMEPRERSIGWVVGPTYDLCERVFNQIVLVTASHLRHRIVSLKEHDRRLILRNMGGGLSEIRGKSADNPVSLLGEGLDWVIVDEASRLKPTIWESHLSQRLIDKKGWSLLISTPRGKGYFYDLWRRGQNGVDADYQSWNLPSWTNPLLDAAAIEEERTRLPERVFMQEYAAQFLEGSGSVFRHVRRHATADWAEPDPKRSYYAGLDLAKVEDFTVLVILNWHREVVFVDRFHRLDWDLQVQRVKAATQRYRHAKILCDVTGVGDPVYESLRRNGCNAQPYPFTARSKADLISNLSLMMEQGKLTLPKPELCPELIDEMESFQFSTTDSGHVRTGAPGGGHDDTVMALALAAWQVRKRHQGASFSVLNANQMAQLGMMRVGPSSLRQSRHFG